MRPKSERMEISRRFFTLVADLSDEKIASLLGVSPRTASRQRAGDTPNDATAERMSQLLTRARNEMGLSEQERAILQEEARAARERYQRSMLHRPIDGHEEKEVPLWFRDARRLIDANNYEMAYLILLHRVQDETDFKAIPDKTKAYVLAAFAITCHYTGRQLDGIRFDQRAIEEAKRHNKSSILIRTIYSNMAGSQLRMGMFDEAIRSCEESLKIDGKWEYAFHNAVCSMSKKQDKVGLALWLGRWEGLLRREYSLEELKDIYQHLGADRDLEWARRQDTYLQFVAQLQAVIASAGPQHRDLRRSSEGG